MKITMGAAATAACLLFAASAHADGYVGLAGGPAKVNTDCSGTTSCDSTGTGFKAYGGYKFTPNLGGELVYIRFGKASASVGAISGDVKPTAIGAGVAWLADVAPNVPFAARVGIARVKTTVSGRFGSATSSDSDSTTSPYIGLSIGYAFSPSVAATLAYDSTRGKYRGDDYNTHLVSVGLSFSF